MRLICIISLVFVVSGCAIQENQAKNQAPQLGTTINVPPSERVDTSDLSDKIGDKITASTNNLQSTMQGLLNASLSKVSDSIKGLEANLNTNFTASAEVRAKLESTINMQNELKAQLQSVIELNNNMQANLQTVAKLDAKLDVVNKLEAKLDNSASVQAGLMNLSEQVKNTFNSHAGRDVNLLPENAVKLLVSNLYTGVFIILLITLVATIVVILSFRASREREVQRTILEREERKRLFGLLTETLTHVPPESAIRIRDLLRKA